MAMDVNQKKALEVARNNELFKRVYGEKAYNVMMNEIEEAYKDEAIEEARDDEFNMNEYDVEQYYKHGEYREKIVEQLKNKKKKLIVYTNDDATLSFDLSKYKFETTYDDLIIKSKHNEFKIEMIDIKNIGGN